METSGVLLLSALLLLFLYISQRRTRRVGPLPPGPKALPLLGNLLQIDKSAPYKSFVKFSKTHGPVQTVYLGPLRVVVLVGYETVKQALVDHADDFGDRAPIPVMNRSVRNYGLAVSNGERWRQLRRFTLSTLRDFGMGRKRMEQWILQESNFLVDTLCETNCVPIDPTFVLSRAVSNVICSLVFGQRFEYDDGGLLRLLHIISNTLQFGSRPFGQLYNIIPTVMEHLPGAHQTMFAEMDELSQFISKRVREHQETMCPTEPRDYIDCFLLRLNKEKDDIYTEFHKDNLVYTVLNLFLAGTESTSTTLRYLLMLLIKYPEIQEKVHLEIDTVIGRDRQLQMEDRKSLPFTDAVIHETQRFLDMVPFNMPHYATKDISFRGYVIPKGTVIIPLLHSVLKDKAEWDTPHAFNPQHFLDHSGNFQKNPAFMPFSAGKRACVGESLAKMELFLFAVTLLQRFTFSCPGGPDSLDPTPELSSFGNLPRKYQLIAVPR